jgi:hypothetical protein
MTTNQLRIVGAGAFFLFIFLTGFGLNRTGKPYNGLLFNLHKLIGLGALIALILTANQIHKTAGLGPGSIAAVVITILFFVTTIIAGGLTSLAQPMPAAVTRLHKIFPYLIVLSSAATLYLLLNRK